ncbi:hypothetical protein NBO_115g0001 [Nosema bombycis CQ1]|uniref:Uncharacterized protein n=1 Tax=Nosema bombycis (strain CQ1 / CVCC 102059) TaxID=578461 RepID=R0M5B7_NOSB1|nr:hypothetical protein NBO_115g0001 [Nosema bombycis CQ1]|eukprot:EOB13204.1 hypothetical protein NBO_115g0001 [Nosema bombycis CQ1]
MASISKKSINKIDKTKHDTLIQNVFCRNKSQRHWIYFSTTSGYQINKGS